MAPRAADSDSEEVDTGNVDTLKHLHFNSFFAQSVIILTSMLPYLLQVLSTQPRKAPCILSRNKTDFSESL